MVTLKSSLGEQVFNCHLTDAGNAEALALLYSDKLRYVHGMGWYLWTGQYWRPDAEMEAMQLVKELARRRQGLIARYAAKDKQQLMILAIGLENTSKVNSCLKMAESTKPFSCLAGSLDTNPMLLACLNGTIELETGRLREPRQNELITHCTEVPYNRDAKCPRFLEFLEEIFVLRNGMPDRDLIQYVKKALGFALTGNLNERCCFIGHGIGGNGKTTLLNVLENILGSYYGTTPFSNLLVRQGNTATNDIAALQGKRLVSAVEVDQLKYLDEVKIKQVTGGDPVTCRFLYHEYFTYHPTFKIFMACNHMPRIRGTDEAIWDRIKTIPFNARFERGVNADLDLLPKLKGEAEGILAWLIDGCLQWQSEGLTDCQTVKDTNKTYRIQEDSFARFIDERIEPKPGNFVTVQQVWMAHNTWAKNNGEADIANINRLGMEMSNRGYRSKVRNKKRGYPDIVLT